MILNFCLAILFSYLGSIPPGSINLSVIQMSLNKNRIGAIKFSLAAAIVEFPYVLLAVYLSNWLLSSATILENLKLISALVMLTLGIINTVEYFKSSAIDSMSRKGFRKGLIISILNPLAIPFWLGVTTYLVHMDWIVLDTQSQKLIYALGVSTGTFLLLFTLIALAGKANLNFSNQKIVKLVIAVVFYALSFVALIELFS